MTNLTQTPMAHGQTTSGHKIHLTHLASGAHISTTPPKDNQGDGSCFSPTDLMATSLGACATTIMSLYAQQHQIPLDSIDFKVVKIMQPAPRKIKEIQVHYILKTTCTQAQFEALKKTAATCPVRLSLNPEMIVLEQFERHPSLF
jgi:putative redox protein